MQLIIIWVIISFQVCLQVIPTCSKPSCCAPPTRVCGAGRSPAGAWGRQVGFWPAGSQLGWACPCEMPPETQRGWAPTPRSPRRPRPRSPGHRRESQRRNSFMSEIRRRAVNQSYESCSMQSSLDKLKHETRRIRLSASPESTLICPRLT